MLRRTFGALLWRERLAQGLRQVDLAALAGLDRRTVERLEAGSVRPSTSSTRKLAVALRRGRDELAVAVLDLDLQEAAGSSLRTWNRRRPLRARTLRVYEQARELRCAEAQRRAAEALAEAEELEAWAAALVEAVDQPAPQQDQLARRPQVRR
ncbi:hypothetical protein GCM10022247_56770 [Allokutzneria multivorans]|uniref:HTH cro/C1-type domain-containing protein n=1 Tax=Allokutzneria multivorans TaxID=1142134 RepID=A0ABP7TEP5_9PSEU